MTFLEKFKEDNRTFYVNDSCTNIGCPANYGYEMHRKCKGHSCNKCWNREMPDTESLTEKEKAIEAMIDNTYNKGFEDGVAKGLNDAWELAKKLHLDKCDYEDALDDNDIRKIFGTLDLAEVMNLTPQEVIVKLKTYEN